MPFDSLYAKAEKLLKPFKPITNSLIHKAEEKIQSLKSGGKVTGKKMGSPKMIKAHVGEYVLPVGVKPTVAQKKAIAKGKAVAKKMVHHMKHHM